MYVIKFLKMTMFKQHNDQFLFWAQIKFDSSLETSRWTLFRNLKIILHELNQSLKSNKKILSSYAKDKGMVLFFTKTCIYGHLRWPFFSPFGYVRVLELFRTTNIWNANNLEGMTLIWKEWLKSGRNDKNLEGMTVIRKEWY